MVWRMFQNKWNSDCMRKRGQEEVKYEVLNTNTVKGKFKPCEGHPLLALL